MGTQVQSNRERLQDAIIEAIKNFAKKEGNICLADLDSMLGRDARLMDILFEKMKISF
ncbi:MAG: hypothetical protein WB948_08025 [Desulfobaccales bacterium]